MFLPTPTHLLQVKNQKKNICSQKVIQKGLITLSNFQDTLLLDLKAMVLLIPSININDIIIDKCKVDRAKTKVKTTAQQKHDQSMENLIRIAVDGRMDKDKLWRKMDRKL